MKRLALSLFVVVALLAVPASSQAAPFVYVANSFSLNVSQYDVGAGGLLSPLVPPRVASSGQPDSVVVSPNGNSVYVTNFFRDNSIAQYDVAADGTLTPKFPATVPTDEPSDIALSPDGRSAYVTSQLFPPRVSQYDVAANGTLTRKTPYQVPAENGPCGVAVSPDGASAYVSNYSGGSAGRGTVSQYNIGPGGTLTPKTPASVAAPVNPCDLVVSPGGASAYVTNGGSSTVSQYDIAANGALSPKTPATVPTEVQPVGVAITPDGTSAYVTNIASDTVSQYNVVPGGALEPKIPATVAAGLAPVGLAVTPDGRSLYVANSDSERVSQYNVGPGGALIPKSPATVATGDHPTGVAVADVRPRRMVGKGAITGSTGGTASYAYIGRCSGVANTNGPFEVRFGTQRFLLTSTTSIACANDPAVTTPAIGFDTQTGSGTGTLTTGGPGTIQWKFVDGGAGGTNDRAQITIRNAANTVVFQGSAAPPGKFPGSTQTTGYNTAQLSP